ncbi:MAG: protein translocase subunit SecD, partial [Syntrophales bacterium]|nr:protein translocase subunit SecD [Syntrophales bacterium]
MIKSIRIRVAITVVVFLAALFYLIPSLTDNLPEFWKKNLPADKIHLGLDLQGGMHLVLEVDTNKALEGTIERMSNDIQENLMEKKIRFRSISRAKTDSITLEFPDKPARDAFEKVLKDSYPDFELASSEVREGREAVTIKIKAKRAVEIKKLAVEQGLETIRNRVDQFGISEPEIIPQGEDRIIVQLPGVKDPGRAKNLIGRTALLEFKLLDEEHNLAEAMKGNIPEGDVIAYGSQLDRESGRRTQIPYLVKN